MLFIQVALRKFNPEKVLTSLGTSASLLPQTLVTMPSPQTRSPCESHYIQNSLFPSNRHPGPPITRSRSQTLSRAAAQHGAIRCFSFTLCLVPAGRKHLSRFPSGIHFRTVKLEDVSHPSSPTPSPAREVKTPGCVHVNAEVFAFLSIDSHSQEF